MGTFHLHADFNEVDDDPSATTAVYIALNVQVVGPGVIYEAGNVAVVGGVLDVDLPANDNDPFEFGYIIRRPLGMTRRWQVPAQDPGASVDLADFTPTTPLPMPDPNGGGIDPETAAYIVGQVTDLLSDPDTPARVVLDAEYAHMEDGDLVIAGNPVASLKTVFLLQAEYDALPSYDAQTLYVTI